MRTSEFASDDWRTITAWLFIVACALLAGFVFGWSWPDRGGALSDVRILDVLIAMGTIGAVVVAITADWRSRRLERRRGVLRARLLAPRLSLRLIGVTTDLDTLLREWTASTNAFQDKDYRYAAKHWCDNVRNRFAMEEVELIAYSPTNCAEQLAMGLAYLDMFSDALDRVHPNAERQLGIYQKAIECAMRAHGALVRAGDECRTWHQWT